MSKNKDEKDEVSKELEKSKSTGWLTSAIGALPSLVSEFNFKKQGNDKEIAMYNAEAAKASASSSPEAMNKNLMWGGIAFIAVILIYLSFKSNK